MPLTIIQSLDSPIPKTQTIKDLMPWLETMNTPAGVSTATIIAQTIRYVMKADLKPRLATHAKRLGVILPDPESREFIDRLDRGFRLLARALGGEENQIVAFDETEEDNEDLGWDENPSWLGMDDEEEDVDPAEVDEDEPEKLTSLVYFVQLVGPPRTTIFFDVLKFTWYIG